MGWLEEVSRRHKIKRRYGATTTGELLLESCHHDAAAALLLVAEEAPPAEEEEVLELVAALTIASTEHARIDRTVLRSVRRTDLMIDDLSEDQAWSDFVRFQKDDLCLSASGKYLFLKEEDADRQVVTGLSIPRHIPVGKSCAH